MAPYLVRIEDNGIHGQTYINLRDVTKFEVREDSILIYNPFVNRNKYKAEYVDVIEVTNQSVIEKIIAYISLNEL